MVVLFKFYLTKSHVEIRLFILGGYYKWVSLEFACSNLTLCALIEMKHFGCKMYIPIFKFHLISISISATYPAADAGINKSGANGRTQQFGTPFVYLPLLFSTQDGSFVAYMPLPT